MFEKSNLYLRIENRKVAKSKKNFKKTCNFCCHFYKLAGADSPTKQS
jgi:hypothetical protein